MKLTFPLSIPLAIALYLTALTVRADEPLPTKTIVNNSTAAKQLLGKHKLSLQWIGWDRWSDFGNAKVTERRGKLFLEGKQQKGGDSVTIDGQILEINAKDFKFRGKIVTQVSHINEGQACERNGDMVFKITNNRKYWRLQQMQNPCSTVTDYVDIFMR
jgi:hypothetical protein